MKVVVLSDKSVGLQSEGATILLLKHENVELHPDQYLGCHGFSVVFPCLSAVS